MMAVIDIFNAEKCNNLYVVDAGIFIAPKSSDLIRYPIDWRVFVDYDGTRTLVVTV
jgi:hypothetical protein